MAELSRRAVVGLTLVALVRPASAAERSRPSEAALALDGYDPVAYFRLGKPTLGLPLFEYVWDEHIYRFVNEEHRSLFKADPVRYAPQFSGFCAMALTRGEHIKADPQSWLISDDKLYVFAKPAGVEAFQQDLSGNIGKAVQTRQLVPSR